jgi:hypothetical protein
MLGAVGGMNLEADTAGGPAELLAGGSPRLVIVSCFQV